MFNSFYEPLSKRIHECTGLLMIRTSGVPRVTSMHEIYGYVVET